MKTKKIFMFGILLIGVAIMLSCKKKATYTQLIDQKPKSTNFQLSYGPGAASQNYTGIQGFSKGDVLLVYGRTMINEEASWGQLPVVISYPLSETVTGQVIWNFLFKEKTGELTIYTRNSDNTSGSPWLTNITFLFKAVVIKSSEIQQNPDVDLSNYEEVKAKFNLEE